MTIPAAGGTAEHFADGSAVALGPDRLIAIAMSQAGVNVLDLANGTNNVVAVGEQGDSAVDVEWNAMGTELAVGLDHGPSGQGVVIITQGSDGSAATIALPRDSGVSWRSPRFGPGGHLYVIESVEGEMDVLRVLDRDGSDVGTVDLQGRSPISIGSDASGTWLIVSVHGGGVLAISPSGEAGGVRDSGEYVSIDW